MNIGYNAKNANDLLETICNGYDGLGSKIQNSWPSVKQILTTEWVGPDEQDFEKKFVEKINNLYLASYELASNCTKTIAGAVDSWVEYQKKNTMDGSVVEDSALAGLIAGIKEFLFGSPRMTKRETVILFTPTALGEDRGLRNADSANKIKEAVNDYVISIKYACKSLFDSANVGSAFYGEEQTKSISTYIDSVETAIGEVLIAVKDFNDALDSLAGSNYIEAQSATKSSFDQSKTSVDTSVENLGSSRWV